MPEVARGWGVGWWFRRQTDLGRPPGSSTQTLKTRAFKDCVDLKKKKSQHESRELSFIWGKMETMAWEAEF